MNLKELQQLAQKLEKSPSFKHEFMKKERASGRRTVVGNHAAKWLDMSFGQGYLDSSDKEQLSRHFAKLWGMAPAIHMDSPGVLNLSKLVTINLCPKKEEMLELSSYLQGIALVLENDRRFYQQYRAGDPNAAARRSCISSFARNLCKSTMTSDTAGVEWLRQYFDERYSDDPSFQKSPIDVVGYNIEGKAKAGKPVANFNPIRMIDPLDLQAGPSGAFAFTELINPTPEEKPVSTTKPIEITTKTLINGVEAGNYSDSEIYALIASEELRIKELSAITNQPKRLKTEIAKREAGITALVAYLDAKDGGGSVG